MLFGKILYPVTYLVLGSNVFREISCLRFGRLIAVTQGSLDGESSNSFHDGIRVISKWPLVLGKIGLPRGQDSSKMALGYVSGISRHVL